MALGSYQDQISTNKSLRLQGIARDLLVQYHCSGWASTAPASLVKHTDACRAVLSGVWCKSAGRRFGFGG